MKRRAARLRQIRRFQPQLPQEPRRPSKMTRSCRGPGLRSHVAAPSGRRRPRAVADRARTPGSSAAATGSARAAASSRTRRVSIPASKSETLRSVVHAGSRCPCATSGRSATVEAGRPDGHPPPRPGSSQGPRPRAVEGARGRRCRPARWPFKHALYARARVLDIAVVATRDRAVGEPSGGLVTGPPRGAGLCDVAEVAGSANAGKGGAIGNPLRELGTPDGEPVPQASARRRRTGSARGRRRACASGKPDGEPAEILDVGSSQIKSPAQTVDSPPASASRSKIGRAGRPPRAAQPATPPRRLRASAPHVQPRSSSARTGTAWR